MKHKVDINVQNEIMQKIDFKFTLKRTEIIKHMVNILGNIIWLSP